VRRIIAVNQKIANTPNQSPFIKAMSRAIIAFIYARLFLGLFGMDTYEIYWWFSLGISIAIYRINDQNSHTDVSNSNIESTLTAKRYMQKAFN
jgi:hypothetical protein